MIDNDIGFLRRDRVVQRIVAVHIRSTAKPDAMFLKQKEFFCVVYTL